MPHKRAEFLAASVISLPLTVRLLGELDVPWIRPVPDTLRVVSGVLVPMPSLVSVVSATRRLDVPAEFWIWKAVVESTAFWKVAAPLMPEMEATVDSGLAAVPKLSLPMVVLPLFVQYT